MPAAFPWWSRRWWHPNCCCKECIIYHDDCRGTEVNDIYSTYWHEIEEPSSSVPWIADAFDSTTSFGEIGYACGDGFLICKTEITESPYNCVVGGKFLWATATDSATARIVVDYVDEDNFHYVDVDHDGSRTGDSIEVRFYDRAAGTDTQIGGTITVDSGELSGWPELYIVVCKSTTAMTLNIFSASSSYGNPWPPFDDQDTSFFAEAAITNKGGKQAGVGMKGGYGYLGGSRPNDDYGMRLQEFWLERTDDENSKCEACERFCCTDTLPLEFDITMSGWADYSSCDNCADLDDTYTLALVETPAQGSISGCKWEYSAGYSSNIWQCDSDGGVYIDRIELVVTGVSTNAVWNLNFYGGNDTTGFPGFQYTRTGWITSCSFDTTESWSYTGGSFSECNRTSVTVTVESDP